jgi:hypothetical protein
MHRLFDLVDRFFDGIPQTSSATMPQNPRGKPTARLPMSFRAFTRDKLCTVVASRLNVESDACRPFDDVVSHFVKAAAVEPSLHALAVRDPNARWHVVVDGQRGPEVRTCLQYNMAQLSEPRATLAMAQKLIRSQRARATPSPHDVRVHPVTVFLLTEEGVTAHKNIVVTSERLSRAWWFEPQQRVEDTKDIPHATLRDESLRRHFAQYEGCVEVDPDLTLQDGDELCQCWCAWYATLRAASPERSSRELLLQMYSAVRNTRGQRDGTHALRLFLHRVYHEVPFRLRTTRNGGTRRTLNDLVERNALPPDDYQYAVPHAWCYRS